MNSDLYSIDSRLQLPNNLTPARMENGFLESKQNPLISGGDAKFSDSGFNFLGKRDDPFGLDALLKEEIPEKVSGKSQKKFSVCFDLNQRNSENADGKGSEFMINFHGKQEKKGDLVKHNFGDSSKCQRSTLPVTPNPNSF